MYFVVIENQTKTKFNNLKQAKNYIKLCEFSSSIMCFDNNGLMKWDSCWEKKDVLKNSNFPKEIR